MFQYLVQVYSSKKNWVLLSHIPCSYPFFLFSSYIYSLLTLSHVLMCPLIKDIITLHIASKRLRDVIKTLVCKRTKRCKVIRKTVTEHPLRVGRSPRQWDPSEWNHQHSLLHEAHGPFQRCTPFSKSLDKSWEKLQRIKQKVSKTGISLWTFWKTC